MKLTKLKDGAVGFFLSKINVDFFSNIIKKYAVFQPIYKLASQQLIDYRFPRHIFVETTSFCNLQCKMCPRNLKPIRLGAMDDDLFKKIVDEAGQFGQRSFSLHLFGEPLCDKDIIEKINYIKSTDPKNSVLLTTNGVLLTPDISLGLIKNGLDKITISIHSPENKTYQSITGQDKLATVEINILEFIRLKKETKSNRPKIFLRLVKIKENAQQITDFYKKWRRYPLKIEVREGHNYGGKIKDILQRRPPRRYPCYHLWLAPGINWDGEVSICCDDINREAIIGNVNNENLSKIWQGEKIERYRRYHLSGQYDKIPLCHDCDVWQIYPDIFFNWQKK